MKQELSGIKKPFGQLKGTVIKPKRGIDGVTFIPEVDEEGNISWTNNGGLENPETINIKGEDYILTEEDKKEISNSVYVEHLAEPIADIEETAERAEQIAKGKSSGYVFDILPDLDSWLLIPDNVAILNRGDNLYIRDTNVPDYWWDGTQKQELETQKVDLSEYKIKDRIPDDRCSGLRIIEGGLLAVLRASKNDIIFREPELADDCRPITPYNVDYAVKQVLTNYKGPYSFETGKYENDWTDEDRAKARALIDASATNNFSPTKITGEASENNSNYSITFGENNISGYKMFKVIEYQEAWEGYAGEQWFDYGLLYLDSAPSKLSVGDTININGGNNYYQCSTITAIVGKDLEPSNKTVIETIATEKDQLWWMTDLLANVNFGINVSSISEITYNMTFNYYLDSEYKVEVEREGTTSATGWPGGYINVVGEKQYLKPGIHSFTGTYQSIRQNNNPNVWFRPQLKFTGPGKLYIWNAKVEAIENNKTIDLFKNNTYIKGEGIYSTIISAKETDVDENILNKSYCVHVDNSIRDYLENTLPQFPIEHYMFVDGKPHAGTHEHGQSQTSIGFDNHAISTGATALGGENHATAKYATAIGRANKAYGYSSVALGRNNIVDGFHAVGIGYNNVISGQFSAALNYRNSVLGDYSFAGGRGALVDEGQSCSFAFGDGAIVKSSNAFAFGSYTEALKNNSFAFGACIWNNGQVGEKTQANGILSFAFGQNAKTNNTHSYSYGLNTLSDGVLSKVFGRDSSASSYLSYAHGQDVNIIGDHSYGHGVGITIDTSNQYVFGRYNYNDPDAQFIVANGTMSAPSNSFVVKKDGSATIALQGEAADSIVRKDYVNDNYVKNTEYAGNNKAGIVVLDAYSYMSQNRESGQGLRLKGAGEAVIRDKPYGHQWAPITVQNYNIALKYGLTQSDIVLTAEEQAAAQAWLGVTEIISALSARVEALEAQLANQ